MNVPDEKQIEIVFDHLVHLTDQVRRLKDLLIAQGLHVPPDLGTLGPSSEEAFERLTGESLRNHGLEALE